MHIPSNLRSICKGHAGACRSLQELAGAGISSARRSQLSKEKRSVQTAGKVPVRPFSRLGIAVEVS